MTEMRAVLDTKRLFFRLWSDPQPLRGPVRVVYMSMSRARPLEAWRGCGLRTGELDLVSLRATAQDVTENFLKTNGLKMVIRSHEMKEEGAALLAC